MNEYDQAVAGILPEGDEYDRAVAQSLQPQGATQARLGFMVGAGQNPEAYAEAKRVAASTGVPVDTVLALPQEMKMQAAMGSIDFDGLAANAPATAALLADVQKASVAHDNVSSLQSVELTLNQLAGRQSSAAFPSLRETPKTAPELGPLDRALNGVGGAFSFAGGAVSAIGSGFGPKFNEGAWGLLRAGGDMLPSAVGQPIADFAASMNRTSRAMADRMMPKSDNLLGASFMSGMQSFGLNIPNIALAFIPGGQAPLAASISAQVAPRMSLPLWSMGATTGGAAYGEARDKGVSVPQSLAFGASQGVIEAGTEMIGMPALFSLLNPGRFAAKAAEYMIKEQGGEQLATHLQDLNEWVTLHPEKNFSDYLADRPAAAVQTALSVLFAGAAQAGTMRGVGSVLQRAQREAEQVQASEQSAALLAQLTQLSAADKLLAREPETFEAFVQQAAEDGPVESVFIDGNLLMQSGLAEPLSQISPAVAAQVAEAAATGGQVAIPVAEYAARIAPTDLAPQLLDHLRTDPEGFTRAEAQAYMQTQGEQLQADITRALTDSVTSELTRASQEAVRQNVLEQLNTAGRFTPAVNDAYSTLVAAHYATRAEQLGMTPEALFEERPLRVVAQGFGGGMFSQGDANATIKGDEFGAPDADVATLRAAARQWYDANLRNTSVVNQGSGREVKFGRGNKAFYTAASPDKVKLFAALPDLIRNGTILKSSTPADGTRESNVKAYHWLEGVVDVGGQPMRVGVTLREDNRGNLYYNHNPIPKEQTPAPELGDTANKTGAGTDTGVYEQSIAQPDGAGQAREKRPRDPGDWTTPAHKAGGFSPEGGAYEQSIAQPDAGVNLQILAQGTGSRGAFSPEQRAIALLKAADLSTFLHEAGHFFFEDDINLASELLAGQRDGASVTPGEQRILSDVATLLTWHGLKGDLAQQLAEWHNMGFEEKRSYHEKAAESFERYLFEGRAPSVELVPYFQRFRAWLVNVYRSLKDFLAGHPAAEQLAPEVRQVFDRMLASEDQITLAEQGRSLVPMFANADEAGMTPEEFARYQAEGEQATADAVEDLQARSLRDLQWLRNARSRELKRLQKAAAEARAEQQMEARTEVYSDPLYQAWQLLTAKVDPDNPDGGARLDATWLESMGVPQEVVNALKARRMTAKNGVHPDVVAEQFGFTSGDELVRKLAAAETPQEMVEQLTDIRMLEAYGELATPEAIERAADEAIHNSARVRMVATEEAMLAKATGKPRVMEKAAREYAAQLIARQRVRDLRPGQYTSAESRAAREAEKARKAGDLARAAAEKRNQLLQNVAAREALKARGEVERTVAYLRRFDGKAKGIDATYSDQIEQLLERFDLRSSQSLRAIDKRTTLAAWLESQREQGLEPDVPADLQNEALRKSYKDMTVEELRGLADTVRQIEHLGRLKHRLLLARDQRAYEAIRDEIVASIQEHAGNRQANTRTPTTAGGQAVRAVKLFGASHIKVATWARVMDGGRDGGPMWEHFVRGANERGDMEGAMRSDATARLSAVLGPLRKLGAMSGKGTFFPSVNRSLNRQERLAIALNTGNEGNLQRLLDGEGWTQAQIQPVLQSLTSVEWNAVQAIWDHFESYRPLIAAKEVRVYGKEPAWIDPVPSTVTGADGVQVMLRGGYYPIKYDPAASQRAEEHSDAEAAKRQMQGAYTSATTRRSFTKTRAEEVKGRPLLYSLSGVYSGVNDVIHDLAWHEWLIDTNRLLRSQSIDKAIRNHYGPEVKQQFKSWSQDIAEGDKGAQAAMDAAIGRLRQGVSVAGLGFNFVSAAMQPLGLAQSVVRVGAPWVGRGVLRYLSNPVSASREANEMSTFMANRSRTRFRELNELRNQVQDQTAFREVTGRYAYWLMMRFQQMADVPTWWGAYEKALAGGNDETRSRALADQAVIDSQGGGETKDLASIERGGPAQRLFTVFYSFMNTALNIGVAQGMTADTPAKRAKLASDMLLLYTVPAVLGALMKDAITPGDSGDDDEKLVRKLIAEQLSFLLGLFVVGREFAEVGKIVAGAEGSRDYTGPAGLRVIGDSFKFGKQALQGEFDDAFRKSLINVSGSVFGLPAAQVNRSWTGAQALAEGETQNPAALAFGFQKPR